MTNDQLEPILPIMQTMVTLSRRRVEPGPPITPDELSRLRSDVRTRLVAARETLAKTLTERDGYLVLFPVVVTLDELVQTLVPDGREGSWPLLQRELFDTDKGGELFYATLDEILETTLGATVVYEIYAFCLRLGFRGRLLGDEAAADEVMERLGRKLAAEPLPRPTLAEPEEVPRLRRVSSGLWYYVAAAGLILLVYYGISWMAEKDAARLATRPDVPAAQGALQHPGGASHA